MKKRTVFSWLLIGTLMLSGCGGGQKNGTESTSTQSVPVAESSAAHETVNTDEQSSSAAEEISADSQIKALSTEASSEASEEESAGDDELASDLAGTLRGSFGSIAPGSAGSTLRAVSASAEVIVWAQKNQIDTLDEDDFIHTLSDAVKLLGDDQESVKENWSTVNGDMLLDGDELTVQTALDAGVPQETLDAFTSDSSYRSCWEAFKQAVSDSGVFEDVS